MTSNLTDLSIFWIFSSSRLYISAAFYQFPDTPSASVVPSTRPVALSTIIVPRTSDTIRLSSTRGTPTGTREILSPRDDGVAERFALTYSSRIYLDPWKLWNRTVPSRYFPFYDSSTYNTFKLAKREAHRRCTGSFQPSFSRPKVHQRS